MALLRSASVRAGAFGAFAVALVASASTATVGSCPTSVPIALPPLSSATLGDVQDVRALVDGGQLGAARSRWSQVSGWSPSRGATAYGRADAAFTAGHERTAFRLYDQVLFCGPGSELNPSAQDSGASDMLDRGLREAADGDFAAAETKLEKASGRDPSSVESRYFLGLVELARGDRRSARGSWKAAIDSTGYAQPPDGWTMPRAQEAALQRYLSLR